MDDLFIGQIVHCKSLNELETIVDGFIAVKNGKIVGVGKRSDMPAEYNKPNRITELNSNQFLVPGFIDCHIHAPQYPNIGLGLDMALLDWLQTYTFPMESNYKDPEFARRVYEAVVRNTLSNGTTFASYFATNYKDSSLVLAEEAVKAGQRALIGKTSSNCSSPAFYVETTDTSLEDNEILIQKILQLKSDLVKPTITPRFAVSCDLELMTGLAKLAKQYDLNIQSHISENLGEVDLIRQMYKMPYAKVYEAANLLNDKCVLAHGVHLLDEELELLKERGTAIAHCPTSNTNLRSGFCDVRRLLNAGVKVGLGTDVSGGSKATILTAIKDALDVSLHLNFIKKQNIMGTGMIARPQADENKNYEPFDYKEVLYLATLGGAEALAAGHKVGNFTVGKEFDALLIDVSQDRVGTFDLPKNENSAEVSDEMHLLQLLQKFIYVGDDRNIQKVFVAGRQVKV